jgi:hypothetical protein
LLYSLVLYVARVEKWFRKAHLKRIKVLLQLPVFQQEAEDWNKYIEALLRYPVRGLAGALPGKDEVGWSIS